MEIWVVTLGEACEPDEIDAIYASEALAVKQAVALTKEASQAAVITIMRWAQREGAFEKSEEVVLSFRGGLLHISGTGNLLEAFSSPSLKAQLEKEALERLNGLKAAIQHRKNEDLERRNRAIDEANQVIQRLQLRLGS